MAHLKNEKAASKQINVILHRALNGPVRVYIKRVLQDRLNRRVTADGDPMPRKAASTVAAYKRKGYDTKRFLVATGESTKTVTRMAKDSLHIEPFDAETLLHNTPESHGRNTLWFALSPNEQEEVMLILVRELAKGLI